VTATEATDAREASTEPPPDRPRRIAVIGTSGSGKTTFAQAAAARLGLRHVELDALFWRPDWKEPHDDEFRAVTAATLDGLDGWVADGNYSRVQDLVFDRVDIVVWLDVGLVTCLRRVVTRAVRRAWSREVMWGTNRERWRNVVGRDSLAWWVVTTHGRRRRDTERLFRDAPYAHLRVHRFRTNAAAAAWLDSV
jgi:adenylate kinase family enzyme